MGNTAVTVEIDNKSYFNIVDSKTSDIDSYDWQTGLGPNNVLQGLKVDKKDFVQKEIVPFRNAANSPFTLRLSFEDETKDTIRIDSKYPFGCHARFKHSERSHEIDYDKGYNKIIFTITNTQLQEEDHTAQILNKRAENEMKNKMLEKANETLIVAKHNANQQKTKAAITKNMNKVGKLLKNKQAEKLNNDAEKQMEKKDNLGAVVLLEKASELANEAPTINKVNENHGKALYKVAKKLYRDAIVFDASPESKPSETKAKFDESETKAVKAKALISEDKYKILEANAKLLECLTAKKTGDKYYNEAVKIEGEAVAMSEKKGKIKNYSSIRKKLQQALITFQLAEDMYKKGYQYDTKNFFDSLDNVGKQKNSINDLIATTTRADIDQSLSEDDALRQETDDDNRFVKYDEEDSVKDSFDYAKLASMIQKGIDKSIQEKLKLSMNLAFLQAQKTLREEAEYENTNNKEEDERTIGPGSFAYFS